MTGLSRDEAALDRMVTVTSYLATIVQNFLREFVMILELVIVFHVIKTFAVYRWAIHNNMEFNSTKFEHYNPKPTTDIAPESVRDLGIIMSSSASFNEHINQRVDKLKSKIGWILRTFQTRDILPMLTLWKTLVLCEREYCSQLWNPNRVWISSP